MRKSLFSQEQIQRAIYDLDNGRKVADIAADLGIKIVTVYTWKRKYNKVNPQNLNKMRKLEEENMHLKTLYIEMAISNKTLRDSINGIMNP